MIVNAAAIIIGYLLGSIPSAYIITRAIKGTDIRQLGSGNVGALNTLRQIGRKAGIAVFLADAGKGVAAVAIAKWGLGVPELFLLLAGLAAVIGHVWPVFLKFTGGRGMAAILGVLAIFMPLHGYWLEFLIFLGVLAISLTITRGNFALCVNIYMVLGRIKATCHLCYRFSYPGLSKSDTNSQDCMGQVWKYEGLYPRAVAERRSYFLVLNGITCKDLNRQRTRQLSSRAVV